MAQVSSTPTGVIVTCNAVLLSVLGKVQRPNGRPHHSLGVVNLDGVMAARRRVPVARPLGEIVEVLSACGLIDLELDQASPIRRKYDVEKPRSVWTDLKRKY